jgi:hypothetical protein
MPFRKGEIANAAEIAVRRAARRQSAEAIETLVAICGDPARRPRARALAAAGLLNRGYGKPRPPPWNRKSD